MVESIVEVGFHGHGETESDQDTNGKSTDLSLQASSGTLDLLSVGSLKTLSGQKTDKTPADDTTEEHASEVTLSLVDSTVKTVFSWHVSVLVTSTARSSFVIVVSTLSLFISIFNSSRLFSRFEPGRRSIFNGLNFFVIVSFLRFFNLIFRFLGSPGLQVPTVSVAVSMSPLVAPLLPFDSGVYPVTNVIFLEDHENAHNTVEDSHEHQALREASESTSHLVNTVLGVLHLL